MEIEEAIWVSDPVKVALQLFGNTEDNRCRELIVKSVLTTDLHGLFLPWRSGESGDSGRAGSPLPAAFRQD